MTLEPTLTAAMDCTDLERGVDAYLDGEFDARERGEADAHLVACPRCRALVERQGKIRDAIRARLREAMASPASAGVAPEGLRASIQEALARSRRPLWRRALAPLPVATLAACAAGVAFVLITHDPDRALVEDAVSKHHLNLPDEVSAANVGEGMIPDWFTGKLSFRPAIPRFGANGVRVLGARVSNVREWSAAYIRYEVPHGRAGLFIVEDPERRFDASGREVRVGTRVVQLDVEKGYNVVTWRDHALVYSLVSDLDEAALYDIVRTARR